MAYETRTRVLSNTRTLVRDLGYELIPICRPKFVFFQYVGLRPSTPHWMFFDGQDVTKWVNTSYSINDFNDGPRNSDFRSPGDKFLAATSFPASLGGPTAASGPIYSNANGILEGVFYIQSNASTSFPIGRRTLTAIDVSNLNKDNSLSYADAVYSAIGQYELFYEFEETYQTSEQYQVWVPDPPVNPPPSPPVGSSIITGGPGGSSSSSTRGSDRNPPPVVSYSYTNSSGGTSYVNRYDYNDVTSKDISRFNNSTAKNVTMSGQKVSVGSGYSSSSTKSTQSSYRGGR